MSATVEREDDDDVTFVSPEIDVHELTRHSSGPTTGSCSAEIPSTGAYSLSDELTDAEGAQSEGFKFYLDPDVLKSNDQSELLSRPLLTEDDSSYDEQLRALGLDVADPASAGERDILTVDQWQLNDAPAPTKRCSDTPAFRSNANGESERARTTGQQETQLLSEMQTLLSRARAVTLALRAREQWRSSVMKGLKTTKRLKYYISAVKNGSIAVHDPVLAWDLDQLRKIVDKLSTNAYSDLTAPRSGDINPAVAMAAPKPTTAVAHRKHIADMEKHISDMCQAAVRYNKLGDSSRALAIMARIRSARRALDLSKRALKALSMSVAVNRAENSYRARTVSRQTRSVTDPTVSQMQRFPVQRILVVFMALIGLAAAAGGLTAVALLHMVPAGLTMVALAPALWYLKMHPMEWYCCFTSLQAGLWLRILNCLRSTGFDFTANGGTSQASDGASGVMQLSSLITWVDCLSGIIIASAVVRTVR